MRTSLNTFLLAGLCSLANAADFQPLRGIARGEDAEFSSVAGHVSVAAMGPDWTDGHDVYDWSPGADPVLIGHIQPTSQGNRVRALAEDGQMVVGDDRYGGSHGFYWTPAGGRQTFNWVPEEWPESVAHDVSADGAVVAGLAGWPDHRGGYVAFRWTEAHGMEPLGNLPGYTYSSGALGISSDGQYIVGSSASGPSAGRAFRWDAVNGLIPLGVLPGQYDSSVAMAVSDDGSVVAGTSGSQVFRWTAATGMVGIGSLSPGSDRELQISGDGATILGTSSFDAFIWTQAGGMRRLRDVLQELGALNLDGWSLEEVLDVSSDGTQILGRGNKGLFMADLVAPPVPALPEAVDDGSFTLVDSVPEAIPVGLNDMYFAEPVTVEVVGPPTKGSITGISAPGALAHMTVSYVRDEAATGTDSFVYRVTGADGYVDTATVHIAVTAEDRIPDEFFFAEQTDVPRNAVIESEVVHVTGINIPVLIAVEGGEYSVDGQNFTSAQGTVTDNAEIIVRHTSSGEELATTSTLLTIGDVSAVFSSTTAPLDPDSDGDGVPDSEDNCTLVVNPGQCDSDEDGYGNHCDGDLTNNGIVNAQDTVLFRDLLGAGTPGPAYNVADLNCNGAVNAQDSTRFRQLLGEPPGPSGLN